MRTTSRVFVARLIGTSAFDPLGDEMDKVYDVVVLLQICGEPRAIGFVIEISSQCRVFLPLSKITAIEPGAVITMGLMNIHRFTQHCVETSVVGELLDRVVAVRDGLGNVTVRDVAIEHDHGMDWKVTRLFVQRASLGPLGLRRGETFTVRPDEVSGPAASAGQQGITALLATLEDLKPADLADAMRDLSQDSQIHVVAEPTDERLADVLEELSNEDAAALLPRLEAGCITHVLDAMQPDDAADLITDLPQLEAAELLSLVKPEEIEDVRRLMAYDKYTAGGLVATGSITLPPESTVTASLAQSRKAEIPSAPATVGFVCRSSLESPTGGLVNMVHFQQALCERPQRMVGSIVGTDVDSVRLEGFIGIVTRLLATYNLTALPVFNDVGHPLGAASIDDTLGHLMPDDWHVADEAVTGETIERSANA